MNKTKTPSTMPHMSALLRARRKELGCTLREMADRHYYSYQAMSKFECGRYYPHMLDTVLTVAGVYELDPRVLVEAILADLIGEREKAKNIYYTVKDHCEFKCSACGAEAGVVEGGSLDGAHFSYCPNCGVELEEEKR